MVESLRRVPLPIAVSRAQLRIEKPTSRAGIYEGLKIVAIMERIARNVALIIAHKDR
jgi:hypothetical protein